MTTLPTFERYLPFSPGFDNLFAQIDRLSNRAYNYPPYNIKKIDEENYAMEFAVAGFYPDDLSVEEDRNTLVVSGENKDDDSSEYIHRGISKRKFKLEYVLPENVVVEKSKFKNGILSVYLKRKLPEKNSTVKIDIET